MGDGYREAVTAQRHRALDEPGDSPSLAGVLGPAAGLLALLLLVALVASPGSFLVRVVPAPAQPQVAASPDPTSAQPAGQAAPPRQDPVVDQPSEQAEVTTEVATALGNLLTVRDAAVADDDATAWASTVGTETVGTGSFVVLSSLPITRFESSMVPGTLEAGSGTTGVGTGDPPAWQAQVRTVYELADGPLVQRTDTVTLADAGDEPVDERGAGAGGGDGADGGDEAWRIASWTPYPEVGATGTAAPWDLGPLHATVGERAVVLTWVRPDEAVADAETWGGQVSTWADRGAVTVDSYLGTGWPRVSLLLVPATVEQYAALVPGPRPAADDVFAAVTTDIETPDGGGDLVVLNPVARDELVAETWQVTVTHELVHVASGARYGDEQEVWLAEGVADLIGWSTLVPGTVGRDVVAARLLERVRAGTVDTSRLPVAEEFADPDVEVVGDAYEGSWLAALLLEEELGTEGVLALYAAASEGPGDARGRTDAALLAATGEGRDAFEARWSSFVQDLAAG